jgi:putative ABC transport system permease protein
MPLFASIASLCRNLTKRGQVEQDLSDEVSSCVELATASKMKDGLTEGEARREALVEFGGVEQVKEAVRASRTGFAVETFFQDLRYGLRSLRKTPGFTLTAVIALALGIGTNSAIFSVINGVLLRSLSYTDPQRLVVLWERNASLNRDRNVVAAANFFDWQKQSTSFENMVAVWDARANLTDNVAEPTEVKAQLVSEPFFCTLGVQPIIGRLFNAEEDRAGNDLVVILSHRLWQNRFGADPAVLGKNANFSGRPRTIVGVMPAGFYFLDHQVDAWAPIAQNAAKLTRENSGRFLRSIARLKTGVTIQQAQAEMSAIAGQLAQQYPDYNKGWDVNVLPIYEEIVRDIRPVLLILLAAVTLVLLIACANVANLLLSRAAVRQKELALRAALGASRLRLARQLLTESILLAVLGGAVGVIFAYWGIHALIAFAPDNLPRLDEIRIDPRVLGFTFTVALFTGVFFGLLPAWQGSRVDLNNALKEGARGSTGGRNRIFRNAFVVAEVALALVLLIGAGLMIRSFLELNRVRTGFSTGNVLTMRVQLPGAKYREAVQRANFFKQAQERIAALPGVNAIGAINFLPLTGLASSSSFSIDGRPEPKPGEQPGTEVRIITPGYFSAMGIPLLKGRMLDEHDGADSRVLLINETLARKYFPGQNPIGQRLTINWEREAADEIVGVVGDVKETALAEEANPAIYWPHPREAYQFMNFVLRAAIDPVALSAAAVREIHALDPDQPVTEIRTLDQVVAKSIARPRFNALLLAIFAGVALVLASVGIYGVMNYSATQRTQEIGIRMALGAKPGDILRLVVGHGMKLTLAGIVIGFLASLALTRVMANLLFGITATDLPTFIAVSAVLTIVALVANYIPARRATRVDPVTSLRYE